MIAFAHHFRTWLESTGIYKKQQYVLVKNKDPQTVCTSRDFCLRTLSAISLCINFPPKTCSLMQEIQRYVVSFRKCCLMSCQDKLTNSAKIKLMNNELQTSTFCSVFFWGLNITCIGILKFNSRSSNSPRCGQDDFVSRYIRHTLNQNEISMKYVWLNKCLVSTD